MANSAVLGCCDDVLRMVCGSSLPFGGKPLVLLGDWRQTCPVIRKGTRAQVVLASIKMSPLWHHFTTYRLITPIRNAEDPQFADFVDSIGDGDRTEIDLRPFLPIVEEASELIDFVYPPEILTDPSSCLTRSILAPTNMQVDAYNSTLLHRVNGLQRTYLAADSLKEAQDLGVDDGESGILDYVAQRTPPGLPPHSLILRTNAVVRLMRNFSIDRGMVKNVRAVVESVGHRIVTVRLMSSLGGVNRIEPEIILIPRIKFDHTLHSGHTLQRRQFPLTLAYATTFNSCQGLTLDRIGVDLTRPVFSHGQLYTALSRIRNRRHGIVRLSPGEVSTTNVTYHEILD